MDASVTRRGQPCWYKVPGVGMTAINDSYLLSSHMFKFISNHFRSHEAYATLLDLFVEVRAERAFGVRVC